MGRIRNRLSLKDLCSVMLAITLLGIAYADEVAGRAHPMMHDGMAVISDARGDEGVLVLAHGGSLLWNENVLNVLRPLAPERPMTVHFGMGINSASALEASVRRLESLGAEEILVIPLFVSSHSLILRQLAYLLGLRGESPFHTGLRPVSSDASIRMVGALDGSPEVSDILIERLDEISFDPSREIVIIVAHGPVQEDDNMFWNAMMDGLKAKLLSEIGFKAVRSLSLRDDAAPDVRQQASDLLRQMVSDASFDGKVIVVPLLISMGGIEEKITGYLEGLDYHFLDQGLVPHPKISNWVRKQIEDGFVQHGP